MPQGLVCASMLRSSFESSQPVCASMRLWAEPLNRMIFRPD
jgi:hypothetical protein